MTNRNRNLAIIGLVLVLLLGAALVIVPGSPLSKQTRLGLDLKGGVELVYEGRPTPQVPEVTPQAVDDAITTIRKRTDALGVSEPEIQRAGSDQISIGLPAVKNAQRAIEQVGSTAQLQLYDYEPNILGSRGPGQPFSGTKALFDAVSLAQRSKPKAEATDIPVDGVEEEVERRFGGDKKKIEAYYDSKNDTSKAKYYLFGPDERRAAGPDSSCGELLGDYVDKPGTQPRNYAKGTRCGDELKRLGAGGPRAGSTVLQVPRGVVVVEDQKQPKQPSSIRNYYVLEDDAELSGSDIKDPKAGMSEDGSGSEVNFDFKTDAGRKSFARVTKRIAQRGSATPLPPGATRQQREETYQRFVATLDNQVISTASISYNDYPEGLDGRGGTRITGLNSIQEANDLAENLRIGALPIELKLISQTQVSATLGQQALNQGLLAGGTGLLLTLIFLLIFYRVLGAVAGVTLLIYAVLLFALVKLIPITLTLPGIAGMILTLGVAADANIVIFERIKEEVRAGRSIPAAISGGYAKALRTIVDANVVTIGVAFILFTLATAGVKGFAFTLGIGTIVSLFTAVLATSAILGSMSRSRLLGSRHALGAGSQGRSWRFDFSGASKWFFSMSGLILLAGALAIAGLGINFGIDFESGTRIKTPVERNASVDDVREALAPLKLGDAKIQKVQEPELGRNVFQIATPTLEPSRVDGVRAELDKRFGVERQNFSSNSIGPTFGQQIARTAVIAIIASLILISIYIGLRFEAKFAVPVLIALAHDLLITAGVYALADREVTTSTVAALLTILGFSLYDTIIVFDRIRENVPRMPRATFSQIANRSMSEVIVRSLVTNVSTLFPVLALMLFGGETLQDFAFALLVGVASGTYSSIFIATPVLTHWKEREPIYTRRRRLALEEHGGEVPAYADASSPDAEEPDAGAPQESGAPAPLPRRHRRRRPRPAGGPSVATADGAPEPAEQPREQPPRPSAAPPAPDGAPEPAEPRTSAAPPAPDGDRGREADGSGTGDPALAGAGSDEREGEGEGTRGDDDRGAGDGVRGDGAPGEDDRSAGDGARGEDAREEDRAEGARGTGDSGEGDGARGKGGRPDGGSRSTVSSTGGGGSVQPKRQSQPRPKRNRGRKKHGRRR